VRCPGKKRAFFFKLGLALNKVEEKKIIIQKQEKSRRREHFDNLSEKKNYKTKRDSSKKIINIYI